MSNHQRHLSVACNCILTAFALTGAFLMRFDFAIPGDQIELLARGLVVATIVKTIVFDLARIHQGWWQFAGMPDLVRLMVANLAASFVFAPVAAMVAPGFPRSIYLIDLLICFLLTAGARFAVRLYREQRTRTQAGKPVLLYGAGAAGVMLAREIRLNPSLGYHVVGFLDDDPAKRNAVLMGVPVLGKGADAAAVIAALRERQTGVEEIVITMPSATGMQMRNALERCHAAGLKCRTIPGVGELLQGKVLSRQIRNVSVTDLLGRAPVQLHERTLRKGISGARVLVTGAAGSIGSELCRQIARFEPQRLIAFDQAESELFKLDLDLRSRCPSLPVTLELGDIRDRDRIEKVIRDHNVDSIFHAAAYKHVPMMEAHPLEAVRNNVLGTWNVVQAAAANQVSKFVLISTDKAVSPTSVMGLTKRAAELMISSMPAVNGKPGTRFLAVRFGNVLGSNGSVIPIFESQIAAGGPVTVTHPEMRRYFMTIPEAALLVLQASVLGSGSEIFVLDMGEPVNITDLARNMIQLSGFTPDKDIAIRYIGLRPGERLTEELVSPDETLLPTSHPKVRLIQGKAFSRETIDSWISGLKWLVAERDEEAVVKHLQALVANGAAATSKPRPKAKAVGAD